MPAIIFIGVLILSYIIGSIPFGLLIVRLKTGKDVRSVESGRTGGTNVMRAAGLTSGIATAILDMLKAFLCVFIARYAIPGNVWLEVLAPVAAVFGHNNSIFLLERDENGRLKIRGGAGGASSVGGATGLWPPILLIILPLGGLILYFLGYASVATLSVPLICLVVFTYRAIVGAGPWEYVAYGILIFIILFWALRPNIRRLVAGNERIIGYRAKRKEQKPQMNHKSGQLR
jgi:glycerol-3-phosphate acyltransferase PlsY